MLLLNQVFQNPLIWWKFRNVMYLRKKYLFIENEFLFLYWLQTNDIYGGIAVPTLIRYVYFVGICISTNHIILSLCN